MAVLENVQKRVILNAGHWDNPDTLHMEDSGASHNGVIEAVECIKIRDAVIPVLTERGYEVLTVPDELDLRQSIAWANQQATGLNDALAIDIHLNYLSNTAARGTETFYGTSETSRKIADAFARSVSKKLGIPNRGAKPDTQTAVGSLGWIRKTSMWATLIEVCFLTNAEDIQALRGEGGYHTVAVGIADAVDELFGQEKPKKPVKENPLAVYSIKELFAEIKRRFGLGIFS